jgi:serine/threonine protein kinase
MSVDDPLIGKKLGDYTIQSLLGRGGMSRVYKGYDENLDRYAAVKVISGDFATTTEEEYTRRFQIEARAIAHLRNPNIVGIYQYGRTEGVYFMAQVFLEGKDLRTLLKEYADQNKRMSPDEIIRIARDVAGALDYAHEQGVIHRDVKPSNIMLERKTGRAILMDFGLALSVREGTLGDTFGSAHYIAPEQAVSSAKAVPQSDLYSLGIVLYEMLAGKVPFDDPSVMSVALKHLNEIPSPPSMYNPDLPSEAEHVIMRALEKDPKLRYATGKEMLDALDAAFKTAPRPAPEESPPVVEMLESEPKPPAEARKRDFISYPRPGRTTPVPTPDSQSSGLAEKFARRKAKKDEEAALKALSEDQLQLDQDSLETFLDTLPDPSEIGLVGPGAKGITLPEKPASGETTVTMPLAPPKRRRRAGVLLPSILVIAIVTGGLWLGVQSRNKHGQNSGGGGTGEDSLTGTATAQATAVAAVNLSITPATQTPGTPDTRTPAVTPTRQPTAQPGQTSPVLTGSAHEPNIRLVYDDGEFLLINISAARVDASRLIFEQTLPTGELRSFTATTWDHEGAIDAPTRMRAGGCYQLLTAAATRAAPPRDVCAQLLSFVQSAMSRFYFWISDQPGATFTVRYANSQTAVATCQIDAGECEFYVGSGGETPTVTATPSGTPTPVSNSPTPVPNSPTALPTSPTPVPVSPTPVPVSPTPTLTRTLQATQVQESNLTLIYDKDQFLLINTSDATLDVSQLVFEQELPDGSIRAFEANEWDRSDIRVPPTEMTARGCYQLVTAEGTQTVPDDTLCAHFLGWFSTGIERRYFWIADTPGASFIVRLAGGTAPLATCSVDAGECEAYLPSQ